jgi:aminopeptidase N
VRASLVTVTVLVVLAGGIGQEKRPEIMEKRSSHAAWELPVPKPFDVLHYSLFADLAMVDSGFRGNMTIQSLVTQSTDTLWFHSVGLVFDSVRVNGSAASYQFYPSAERFTVYLPRTFAVGETVRVFIKYARNLAYPRLEDRQGYYWYRQNNQPGLVHENIGYTMSEPYDARLWMPCFDDPSDKATCEISVSVPPGYVAGSNGKLVSVISIDSAVVYHWREDYPIATYLMCITASKYSTFSHFYRKITNPSDSIEVKYYCWREDSSGTTHSAELAFNKTTLMMERFAAMFGEYPFEKYGMAVAYPFSFGGMEHQTLTTMHRSTINVSGYPFYEYVVAHELAHQWWGNMVTCRTFADIWLNEGFATYSEALWEEQEYDRARHDQRMRNYLVFGSTWQGAIYDPISQGLPLFGSQVYHKAGWVLYMLRSLVGDSMFFDILASYRATHGYGTATTADFNGVVNTTTGQNHDWFFNQWIYGRGWPKFAYTTTWDGVANAYSVTVYQMQDTLWPTFRVPVELRIYTGADSASFFVVDSLRTQVFSFSLPSQPDSLQLDPRNRIMKQIVPPPLSVDENPGSPTTFALHQNYPNPFNPSTVIRYRVPISTFVTLRIFNVLGQEIATLVNGVSMPGTYEVEWLASQIPSGVYFYRLTTSHYAQTRKLILLK